MKKFIYVIILSLILGITYYFRDDLANTFLSFSLEKKETSILQNNIYSTNRNHQYVRLTNDFIADNEKDSIILCGIRLIRGEEAEVWN